MDYNSVPFYCAHLIKNLLESHTPSICTISSLVCLWLLGNIFRASIHEMPKNFGEETFKKQQK